ncbi:MAG: S1/P1 nuclease [Lysobacterales bacterium]|jgi:hypothetical protein
MRRPSLTRTILCAALFGLPGSVFAWGHAGHAAIANAAFDLLDDRARSAVVDILGSDSPYAMDEACNWPDRVRETPEWAWSAPQHFVNIPRSATHYDRQRDCPDGLCVTEAIKKYASALSGPQRDAQHRWQALAWVCHLVGDLHQPLHAGYRDDRGGNLVEVTFRGQLTNLHEFWDSELIRERMNEGADLERTAAPAVCKAARQRWNPESVDAWTDESHTLAATVAYPPNPAIDEDFAQRSWPVVEQQLRRASCRLASVLNAVLGDSGVVQER